MKKQDITYQDKLNELRLDILHPNSLNLTRFLLTTLPLKAACLRRRVSFPVAWLAPQVFQV